MKILFISNFIFLQRVQVMNMFQAEVRSPWIYDHYWEVLKYCDKWMIISQSNPRPCSPVYEGTHETPVSLDSDQDQYNNATVSSPRKRPPGRKKLKKLDKKVRRIQQILVILFQIRFVKYLGRVKRERIFMRRKSFNY